MLYDLHWSLQNSFTQFNVFHHHYSWKKSILRSAYYPDVVWGSYIVFYIDNVKHYYLILLGSHM